MTVEPHWRGLVRRARGKQKMAVKCQTCSAITDAWNIDNFKHNTHRMNTRSWMPELAVLLDALTKEEPNDLL